MDDNQKLMWKCGVIGSFLVTLALCIAALFSPAWIQASGVDIRVGLFRSCGLDLEDSCVWNAVGSEAESWVRASQALLSTGSFILFIMAVTSFSLFRYDRYTGVIGPVTSVGSFVAMILMIAAVAEFGTKASSEFFVPGSLVHFGWGFGVAIATACCCAVACILSFVSIRVMAD